MGAAGIHHSEGSRFTCCDWLRALGLGDLLDGLRVLRVGRRSGAALGRTIDVTSDERTLREWLADGLEGTAHPALSDFAAGVLASDRQPRDLSRLGRVDQLLMCCFAAGDATAVGCDAVRLECS